MPDINLKQLEAFVATAEYRSFTRAAEALYLTQSTVSAHVSTLEQLLGVQLIERGARKRVTLTETGETVYAEAKDILRRCEALQRGISRRGCEQLLLGASTVPGQYLLPEIMSGFLRRRPDARFSLLRGDTTSVHQMLDENQARLGFVGAATDPNHYHYRTIAEDRLVVAAANIDEFRTLRDLGIHGHALLDRPLVLRAATSGTRKAVEAYLMRHHIPLASLHIIAEIDDPEAVKAAVSSGLGVSILSELAVKNDVESGRLLAFPLDSAGAFRKILLAWRRDLVLTAVEEAFIGYVLKNATPDIID